MGFVHLSVHTHYSFLQGLGKPADFVARAKELEMPAIAITDAGNLHGTFEFYKACKNHGMQAIIGVDCVLSRKGRTNRDKDNDLYALTLLATTREGYSNLINLVTESYLTGYYLKPRIDFELLEKYRAGLTVLTGDTFGEIPQHIITGRDEAYIRSRVEYYRDVFGKENVFLELQEHADRPNQGKVNEALTRLATNYGYELVATNGCYYPRKEDAEAQDLLSAINDGRTIDDPDRASRIEGDYSLRSEDEMKALFAYAPRAIENTGRIAERVDFSIDYGKILIPKFTLDNEDDTLYKEYVKNLPAEAKTLDHEEWNLRRLCIEGLTPRYDMPLTAEEKNALIHKRNLPPAEKALGKMSLEELLTLAQEGRMDEKRAMIETMTKRHKEVLDRLDYELTVVDLMGFNGYFNIVADFIGWAKKNGVPVGPGRGSAAGAVLAYLSGITDIDPLKYQLLFERFLNPARVSMPDIDVDFSDEGRDRVVEYVRNKYGSDHVAQICTFGTMAARAAIKDVGKALGIPFAEMNELSKLVPSKPGTKIADALEESVEFKQAYASNPHYKKVVDYAKRLEGCVRQLGVHACAVIIAPEPMTRYCALQHPPKDPESIVTQLSQYPLEELGLLKMDFLGLRNLAIIDRACRIIENAHGKKIDMLKINYEDHKVFEVFAAGDTTGVFQFESPGMRRYLRELKPNAFEDIIVMVSLYRPGPMLYIPTYIARKYGREKVQYPHPSLEAILKPTQGIAVYQEQIMQLVQAFAGFSLGEADILRRAIGKKKIDLLMEQKEKFMEAAKSLGHGENLAQYIFSDIIEPFAGYGFNKSHAACYAMIAYQTAYLKAYHPTEFMTAVMVSDEEDTERITLEIEECKTKGIQILPPDVNESRDHFTFVDKKTIRFGLKAIKGLGQWPIENIQKGRRERPYTSILDFVERVNNDVINKKSLEALTLSGALDCFGERGSILASIPKMSAIWQETIQKRESQQIGLFDAVSTTTEHHFSLTQVPPMEFEDRIRGERETMGYSVSGHPLDGLGTYATKYDIGREHIRAFEAELLVHRSELPQILEPEEGMTETEEDAEPTSDPKEQEVQNQEITQTWQESNKPLQEELQTENEKIQGQEKDKPKEDRPKPKRVRFLGAITSVRKMQTKSGTMMAMAACDAFDFRFNLVIFPKDYEKFQNLLEVGKLALVQGNLRTSVENGEISVSAMDLRTMSVTAVRAQAKEIGIFRPEEKAIPYRKAEDGELEVPTENKTPRQDIQTQTTTQTCRIVVPEHATRPDLVDLKGFLLSQKVGDVCVELYLQGQVIDTKCRIANAEAVHAWVLARWE